jgi:hypothetical protein
MIKKHHSITNFIALVNNKFANSGIVIKDYWEGDLCATGIAINNKLIYVSTYKLKPNHYFYECEILLDDEDNPYLVHSTEKNVSEERLLEVISEFFEIDKQSTKLKDPETGQYIEKDNATNSDSRSHGDSHWKLYDKSNDRIGSIAKDGRWLRK